jgi:uncharacterized protein (UPF0332 family)
MYLVLYSKALRFAQDARNSLDDGSADSAVNRAYYAMFNAARAFLDSQGVSIAAASHGAVLQLFGRHAIKTGKIEPEFGRQLNRAMEARSVADYDGVNVAVADARVHVEAAEKFVDRIAVLLPSLPPGTRRAPSAEAQAQVELLRKLAHAFCQAVEARGVALPTGLKDQIVIHGAIDSVARALLDVEEMTDLSSFVAQHFPRIQL